MTKFSNKKNSENENTHILFTKTTKNSKKKIAQYNKKIKALYIYKYI